MKSIPFCDVAAVNREVGQELEAAARNVMSSNGLILGPHVEAFEHEFAEYCRAKYCVGVGCGLDALTLMLRACSIGLGDEVIVASNTFIGTWLAVSASGARPVPVESDVTTMNIDPKQVEASITHRTRAILATHLYGRKAEMLKLRQVADRRGLRLLVDAAQAHGIKADADGLGDAAAFSFYPTKNLGALGDGGAVITSIGTIAKTVRMLRNYGTERKDEHQIVGVNSRLDELQAAFLRVKLRKLDEWNERRRANATIYDSVLRDSDVFVPDGETVNHLYVIQTQQRAEVRSELSERGIATTIHYPKPPHRQPAYCRPHRHLPVADTLSETVLSLPVGPELDAETVRRIAESTRDAIAKWPREMEAA